MGKEARVRAETKRFRASWPGLGRIGPEPMLAGCTWVPHALGRCMPGCTWPGCCSPGRAVRRRWLTLVWPKGGKEKRKKEERRRGNEREKEERKERGEENESFSGLSGFKSRL